MARLCRATLTVLGVTATIAAIAVSSTPGAAHAAPTTDDLTKQIEAKGRQLDAIVEQWNGLNLALANTTEQAQQVATKLGPLSQQVDAASDAVDTLATQAYEGGQVAGWTALITAGSPEDFLDRLSLLDTVAGNQRRSVATLNSAAAALNAQKQQLDLLLATQSQQKAGLDAQKSKITAEITALQKQRNQLAAQTRSSSTTAGSTTGTAPAVSGKAGIAVRYAYAQLGKPYVFGAAGPNSFDCSGLTMAAWAAAGVHLDHYTGSQIQQTATISRSQLQPGDLVFFYGGSHVGLYVGNNSVIHAPQPGEVVKISSIDWMGGYYASRRVR